MQVYHSSIHTNTNTGMNTINIWNLWAGLTCAVVGPSASWKEEPTFLIFNVGSQ